MTTILQHIGNRHSWTAQIVLRLFGAALLSLCAAASWWLYRSAHHPPPHGATALEYLDAAVAVATWSLGWAFFVVGPALFELVQLPPRYRQFVV